MIDHGLASTHGLSWEDPCKDWNNAGPGGDESLRLIRTLCIFGVPHHLEAWRVVGGEGGVEQALDSKDSDCHAYYAEWSAAAAGDGPFETVNIGGKQYVLFLSPFCR